MLQNNADNEGRVNETQAEPPTLTEAEWTYLKKKLGQEASSFKDAVQQVLKNTPGFTTKEWDEA